MDFKLSLEERKEEFNNQIISYIHHELFDNKGNKVKSDFIDEINEMQLQYLFREQTNNIFVDELKLILKLYNVSPSYLSNIFGLGTNIIREYERGKLPSNSICQMIRIYKSPEVMRKIILRRDDIKLKMKEKILSNIEIIRQNDSLIEKIDTIPSRFTGYGLTDSIKLRQMILFLSSDGMDISILPLVLFFCDFGHYRLTVKSISGSRYFYSKTVYPEKYFRYIDELINEKKCVVYNEIINDSLRLIIQSNDSKDILDYFQETEKIVIDEVKTNLQKLEAKEVFILLKSEMLFQDVEETHFIDYQKAFYLSFPKLNYL
ncbi:MAG: hypothetical protein ACOCUH_04700 [Bacteriovoracia bacterium]